MKKKANTAGISITWENRQPSNVSKGEERGEKAVFAKLESHLHRTSLLSLTPNRCFSKGTNTCPVTPIVSSEPSNQSKRSLSARGDSHITGIGTKSQTECNHNYLTSFFVFLFNNIENSWKVGSLRSDAKVAQLIYDRWQKWS